MAGTMRGEDARVGGTLITSREPVAPSKATGQGSIGDTAFKDSVAMILGSFALLVVLMYTLRRHNI